jgi:hypothetical protein
VGARRTGWPTLPDDQTAVNPLYGIFGQLRPRFRTEIDTVGNAVAEPDYRIVSRVEFLQATYLLDASDPQEAIDVLVDRLDDLQNGGDFDEVDAILFHCSPGSLSAPSIVSILGVTLAAKRVLAARALFFSRARQAVAAQRGSEEAAARLLDKYR